MSGLLLSFRSEFYKTRKTGAFWSPILLPLLLCGLVLSVFLSKSDQFSHQPGAILWFEFAGAILAPMGSLILPILIVFIAYSVNNIEHKADTWKTLFSLPISKFSVYSAKFLYALFLVFICLLLFVLFTLGFANLLSVIKPSLRFSEYSIEGALFKVYIKLFLDSLGILSIQFLLSLLMRDFLKPMGIGFICTIAGDIISSHWQYSYLFPYSHPLLAIQAIGQNMNTTNTGAPQIQIDIFTKEVFVSMAIAVVVFVAGYFIVLKKSVK
jgi:hypothetical protein